MYEFEYGFQCSIELLEKLNFIDVEDLRINNDKTSEGVKLVREKIFQPLFMIFCSPKLGAEKFNIKEHLSFRFKKVSFWNYIAFI